MQPLAVERTSRDGVELVLVEGEVDIASASRLISVLNSSVAEAIKSVIVDLSHVGFMDSTGLALLINANRRLTLRRKGFAVVCPPGPLLPKNAWLADHLIALALERRYGTRPDLEPLPDDLETAAHASARRAAERD